MYFVYILFSIKDGKLYIGFTSNLEKRLARHQIGLVPATQHRLPVMLIAYESCIFKTDAQRREIFLKSGKGREQLKIQLQNTFKEIGYRFRE